MRKLRRFRLFVLTRPESKKLKINLALFLFGLAAVTMEAKLATETSANVSLIEGILQDQVVIGTILDENNVPLPGATVLVEGTAIGTTSDFDGNYSISVPESATKLVFSYIGYETQTVTISGRNEIDIQLQVTANALDEVVVTALGIERSKRSLAYSVSKVGGDEFTEARETNVANSLTVFLLIIPIGVLLVNGADKMEVMVLGTSIRMI